jgi:hypothetical protein
MGTKLPRRSDNNMEWSNLSNEAKRIIEWVENPYTNEKETVEIKNGETFHRDCPKFCGDYSGDDLKCDIPVTKELYQEVLRYVTEDDKIQCEQFMDGLLIFRLKDIE